MLLPFPTDDRSTWGSASLQMAWNSLCTMSCLLQCSIAAALPGQRLATALPSYLSSCPDLVLTSSLAPTTPLRDDHGPEQRDGASALPVRGAG